MTTPKTPATPAIPLADEVRMAYQDLYNKLEIALQNTTDVELLKALNSSQRDVDEVLTNDDEYKLHANTEQFEGILKQFNKTNDGLKSLKDQIGTIAAHFEQAADIVAAISKVLTFVPGA